MPGKQCIAAAAAGFYSSGAIATPGMRPARGGARWSARYGSPGARRQNRPANTQRKSPWACAQGLFLHLAEREADFTFSRHLM